MPYKSADAQHGPHPYTREFFLGLHESSVKSAAAVVPLVMVLCGPKSVVDVGCGTGAWLSAFRAAGVADILGLDGDYVDRRSLVIPPESFLATDLAGGVSLNRTFDLCVSLEVGEHLPSALAPNYVTSLVKLAPVVLFSAAVPGQTGVGHVNERWPAYWIALFAEHGYLQLDPLRAQVWHDDRVAWWYRQNLFLYVHRAQLPRLTINSPDILPRSISGRELLLLHSTIVDCLEGKILEQESRLRDLRTGRGALRVLSRALSRMARRLLGRPLDSECL